jgi:Protein of unknown function (DUF2510)
MLSSLRGSPTALLATSCISSNGTTNCTTHISGAAIGFLIVVGIFYLALIVFMIVCYVKIIHKAGYSAWWLLTALVPLLNLVMIAIFAFAEWPVIKEVKSLRAMGFSGGGGQAWTQQGAVAYGSGSAPAGWFPSGNVAQDERFWDGNNWTEHYRPKSQ